jgi:hypothetical protein
MKDEKDIINSFPAMFQGILNILRRTTGTVSEEVCDADRWRTRISITSFPHLNQSIWFWY